MGLTGSLMLALLFSISFTLPSVPFFPEYNDLKTTVGSPDGSEIHDVYNMILAGFRVDAIAIFYVSACFYYAGILPTACRVCFRH